MDKAEKRLNRGEPIKLTELNMTPILVALIVGFIAVGMYATNTLWKYNYQVFLTSFPSHFCHSSQEIFRQTRCTCDRYK